MPSPFAARLEAIAGDGLLKCIVPGCGRPTQRVSGTGFAARYCRRHVAHKARHGSATRRSYSASELLPYLRAAASYLNPRLLTDPLIRDAVSRLAFLIEGAAYEQATRLRGLPPSTRAEIAFGRFRKRGVRPEKLLAIHMAVTALIAEDHQADRSREFRLVQIAKVCHRRASGHHLVTQVANPSTGRTHTFALHAYARSTGKVLRLIGKMVDDRAAEATGAHLEGVIRLKVKRYGPHRMAL